MPYDDVKVVAKSNLFQVVYYDKSQKVMVTKTMTRRELVTLIGDFGYCQLLSAVAFMEAD